MKKLFSYVIAIVLTLSLAFVAFGCDNTKGDDGEDVATGSFKYEIVTEQRDGTTQEVDEDGNPVVDDFGDPVYEQVEYKFYKITGFTVSSEDAEKMADGDFSTVEKYRKITVPETYEEIAMSDFASQPIFTEITVGDNIKKIGEGAFAGCTNLTSLSLPFVGAEVDAVNEFKLFGYVFSDAVTDGSSLVTGKLHQRVDETGAVISSEEDISYYIPDSLKKVEIRNVTEISECAFYGMATLEEIVLKGNVTKIGNHAFFGCSSLLKMELPETTLEIGDYAFSGASSLYSVSFGANPVLEVIGSHAFDGCSLLNSSYVTVNNPFTLPTTVKEIGAYAYKGCTSIKNIDLSNLANLTVYETGVFSGCTALVSVNFNGVSGLKIRTGAFNGCTLLKKGGLYVNGVNNVVLLQGAIELDSFDFGIED